MDHLLAPVSPRPRPHTAHECWAPTRNQGLLFQKGPTFEGKSRYENMQEQCLSQWGRDAHIRTATSFEKGSVVESWRQGGAALQGARQRL